ILRPRPTRSFDLLSGGTSRYAPSAPASAGSTVPAYVTSPLTTSAPRERSAATLSGLRTTRRTFLPASIRRLATTEPVFPLAPNTVNMGSSFRSTSRTAAHHITPDPNAREAGHVKADGWSRTASRRWRLSRGSGRAEPCIFGGEGVGERPEERGAVTAPRASVHARQRRRFGRREPSQQGSRMRGMRIVVEPVAECLALLEDLRRGDQRPRAVARLREQIAAQQRARSDFKQVSALPGVREVRRVEPADPMTAERQLLAIRERTRRTIEAVAVDQRVDPPAHRFGARGNGEEVIERATLVRFVV